VSAISSAIPALYSARHREFHADAGSAKLVGREKMIAALQRLKTSYEPQEANSMMAFAIRIIGAYPGVLGLGDSGGSKQRE
jgi:heat shock protein HtpX